MIDLAVIKMFQNIRYGKQAQLLSYGFNCPKFSSVPKTERELGQEVENMPVTVSEIDSQIGEAGGSKFVKLEAGRAKILVIDDANLTTLTMTDSKTGVEKIVNGIALTIVGEDGKPCKKEITLTSKKLINQLKADLAKGLYKTKALKIMKIGEGFNVEYETSWLGK